MESALRLLDELEDLIENGRPVMFSNKISIDKEIILDLLQELRLNLPKELEQSNWVIEERNRIIIDAEREAELIVEKAEDHTRKLVDEHQIAKEAEEKARQIIDESKQDARDIRVGAFEYADKVLSQLEEQVKITLDALQKETLITEKVFNTTINEIFENRQLLRGSGKKN